MQHSKMKTIVGMKWSVVALIAVASLMTLAGTRASAGTDAAPQVSINNYAFSPVPLTVKVGSTVTWTNHDDDPHSVDSADGKFKSAALDTDGKFEFRFTAAGEYPYNCRFHPKMKGTIIVQP